MIYKNMILEKFNFQSQLILLLPKIPTKNKQCIQRVVIQKLWLMTSDEIIAEHFDLLLSRYQISLETQVRGSDFIFNGVN